MSALTALILLLFSYIAYRRIADASTTKDKLPLAPLDEASLVLGHQYRIDKTECGVEYTRWTGLLGKVFRIKAALFQPDVIIVSDHLAIQHITQNAYTYSKSEFLRPIIATLLGRGVLWAEGEEHRVQRKLIAPAFTPSAIKAMSPTVLQVLDKTVQRFQNDIAALGGTAMLNLPDYIGPCIFEIVGRVGFNHDLGYNTTESKQVLAAWKQDVQLFSTFGGWLAPHIIGLMPWITKLPIKALHEDSIVKKIVYKIGNRMLEEQKLTGEHSEGTSIFSVLVKESGSKIDEKTLLDNIVTFLVVGHETTASAIHFTLYDLARNLEAQTRLREEVMDVDFTFEALDKLPYLDAVVREGIRLHPAARDTERVALADDVIPLRHPITLADGSVITSLPVKKGDKFILPFMTTNQDPDVWGPDGAEFVPERWLDNSLEGRDLPRGPYTPTLSFLDGARMCVGWRLAVMEVKLVIAGLVKAMEFKEVPGVKVDRIASPALQPFVNGQPGRLPVRVTPVFST